MKIIYNYKDVNGKPGVRIYKGRSLEIDRYGISFYNTETNGRYSIILTGKESIAIKAR